MVRLSTALKTKQISFNSIPGSSVVIKEDLTAGEFSKVQSSADSNMMLVALEYLITEWNLTDDQDKVLEISAETLGMIPIFDLKDALAETRFGAQLEEIQKKSNTN